MYEVEVKVRADHAAVRSRLEDAGAACQRCVEQSDTYFDAPYRDFAETDEALRLRRVTHRGGADGREPRSRLTYKGPRIDAESKTRREIETGVDDGEDATAILEALDFAPVATVKKTREYYRFEGYTVVLDDVEGLGEFVEIETEVPEDDEALEAARTEAFDRLRDLGLDPGDQVRTSYLGLLLE